MNKSNTLPGYISVKDLIDKGYRIRRCKLRPWSKKIVSPKMFARRPVPVESIGGYKVTQSRIAHPYRLKIVIPKSMSKMSPEEIQIMNTKEVRGEDYGTNGSFISMP